MGTDLKRSGIGEDIHRSVRITAVMNPEPSLSISRLRYAAAANVAYLSLVPRGNAELNPRPTTGVVT